MNGKPTGSSGRILWQNVMTVVSAAILIGAEVFGAAFAGGWAVASYLDLGIYGEHIVQGLFFICGVAVMTAARSEIAASCCDRLSSETT
jgi:hypothetical protein